MFEEPISKHILYYSKLSAFAKYGSSTVVAHYWLFVINLDLHQQYLSDFMEFRIKTKIEWLILFLWLTDIHKRVITYLTTFNFY